MRRLFLTIIVYVTIILVSSTLIPIHAQSSDPPVFSETLEFELRNMLGSDGYDWIQDMVVDSEGNIILAFNVAYPIQNTGNSGPPGFYTGPFYDTDPDFREFNITAGAYDRTYNGEGDIVLTKMNQDGEVLFSTYFGGPEGDFARGVAVDSNDNIFMIGYTRSEGSFPLKNAIDTTPASIQSGFITKFNSSGNLEMSTFFGGEYVDKISDIYIDEEESIFVIGATKSEEFPKVNAAFPDVQVGFLAPAAFIAKFNKSMDIQFSTLLGGSEIDDDYTFSYYNGTITIFGLTKSPDFPVTENAPNPEHNGYLDAFITRFNATTGEALLSTFIGGSHLDWISDSTIDQNGSLIVVGYSNSKDYPVDDGEDTELNNGYGLASDAIITKVHPNGSVLWSTFLGGSTSDRGVSVMVDSESNIIMLGETTSEDFPIWGVSDEDMALNQGREYESGTPPNDVYLSKFVPDGRLAWSVVMGSQGEENFASAHLIDDGSVVFGGHTEDKQTFRYTNDYVPAALDEAFLAIAILPEVELGPIEDYQGYKFVEENTEGQNFIERYVNDPTTAIVVSVIAVIVLFNVVTRSGIIQKLQSRQNQEWKKDIQSYYDKMKNLDEPETN